MNNFEMISGGRELLDLVQPLWEKLNKHHEAKSSYFSGRYKNFTFEERKAKFNSEDNVDIRIDLVKDNDIFIGYCVSTINKESAGEIDSLFVEEQYRKYGLGDKLIRSAIEWLDNNKVKSKIIGVAAGNENVLDFYARYGFYKKAVILEQKCD